MKKVELIAKVVEVLDREIANAEQTLATIRQAAIDAPGAMQSHSDTTKFQMGGLADELAGAIAEKRRAIAALNKLALGGMVDRPAMVFGGSLVEIEELSRGRALYFILPEAGGIEIDCDGKVVTVVTFRAPLAVALLGKKVGEVASLCISGNSRDARRFTIIDIE